MKIFAPANELGELQVQVNAVKQMERCLGHPAAVDGALMADHHLGYAMPIGGVIAYDGAISPTGVGFDIACGNMAVKTNILFSDLGEVKPIMRAIQKKIEFGVGKQSEAYMDDPVFDHGLVWHEIDRQFGTGLNWWWRL